MKSWRKRWTVLTQNYLLTFRSDTKSKPPTTWTKVSTIRRALHLINENFQVQAEEFYEYKANSEQEAKEWVHLINKYRTQNIKIPISIQCPRNEEFNDGLCISVIAV